MKALKEIKILAKDENTLIIYIDNVEAYFIKKDSVDIIALGWDIACLIHDARQCSGFVSLESDFGDM